LPGILDASYAKTGQQSPTTSRSVDENSLSKGILIPMRNIIFVPYAVPATAKKRPNTSLVDGIIGRHPAA
jgi:hypothetical protein